MKSSILIMILFLLTAPWAQADTAVYQDGDRLMARLDTADSQRLYQTLGIVVDGRNVKAWRSPGEIIEVYCYKNTLGVGIPYGCTISINYQKQTRSNPVYQEGGKLKSSIHGNDANSWYSFLRVQEERGRSGSAKQFQTNDQRAGILCIKDELGISASPYTCTISISQR